MRKPMLAMAGALLIALLSVGTGTAQQPQQASLLNVAFRGVETPAPTFDLVESVIDFSPGAASAASSTTAQSFLSVFEGEVTVQVDGKQEVVALGKGLAISAGANVAITNSNSGKPSRVFISTLARLGEVGALHPATSPGVTVFFTARRTMANAPALIDVIQQGAQYDPGFRTGNHVMNEFHLMIHLAGQTTYGYLDGSTERFPARSEAVMREGNAGWMANEGQEKSAVIWTWLGTPGKPLTSAVTPAPAPATAPAPAPPNTGNSLGLQVESRRAGHGQELGFAGLALLALAVLGLHAYRRTPRQH